MHILVIDSDPLAAAQLGDYLEAHGHSVDYAALDRVAVHLAKTEVFAAIVLDHGGGRLDGLSLCRKLQTIQSNTPVLYLLGAAASADQVAAAFDAGAQGVLVGPVANAEVQARLCALWRTRSSVKPARVMRLADLQLDLGASEARRRGAPLALTPIGLRLLGILMEASPKALSFRELATRLWGEYCESTSEMKLRAQVYSLRCKVDRPFETALIRTRTNLGYCIVAPEDACQRDQRYRATRKPRGPHGSGVPALA